MSLINVDDKELNTLRVKSALADWFFGPFDEDVIEEAREAGYGEVLDLDKASKATLVAQLLLTVGAAEESLDVLEKQAAYSAL